MFLWFTIKIYRMKNKIYAVFCDFFICMVTVVILTSLERSVFVYIKEFSEILF